MIAASRSRAARQLIGFAVLGILFVLASSGTAEAATITVSNLNDSGAGSLRQAILDAAAGDTIDFSVTGTILLLGSHLSITKNLTISGPGAASLTIDGNALGPCGGGIFVIGSGATVFISGLTLTNGKDSCAGGAIFNQGTLTISNSVIKDSENTGSSGGGGIYSSGNFTLIDSVISGNVTGSLAGGLRLLATSLIQRSTISGNTSSSGFGGGGIHNGGNLTIEDSTIRGNTGQSGGGISNSGALTVDRSTISGNDAGPVFGGGIRNQGSGTVTVTNTTISGNVANGGGGVAGDGSSAATYRNTTITKNTATSGATRAGGVFLTGGSITFVNSIIADNSGTAGAPDCNLIFSATLVSLGYNLIGDGSGCAFPSTTGDKVGTGASPVDAELSPLADFGGLTKTHALFPGSPAIDAGNPDAPGGGGSTCESTDQRGVTRPKNGRCDIGAYEFDAAADEIPSLSVWGLIVMAGLLAAAYVWRTRRRSQRQPA